MAINKIKFAARKQILTSRVWLELSVATAIQNLEKKIFECFQIKKDFF